MKRKERYSPDHYYNRNERHNDYGGQQRQRRDDDRRDDRDRDRRQSDRSFGGDRGSYRGGGGGRGYDSGRGRGGGRGGGGRGRGGGRPCSPVRKDVRRFAEAVTIKRTFKDKKRGTEGREVELVTNHYPIEFKGIPIFQYDIDIKLKMNSTQEFRPFKGSFREKIKVWDKLVEEWPEMFVQNKRKVCYAFDGNKNVFCLKKLQLSGESGNRNVILSMDGYPEQTFEVVFKHTRDIDMDRINTFFEAKSRALSVLQYRDVLQVLDIVSHFWPMMNRVTVGRNLFPIKSSDRIEVPNENTVIVFGHHQSVVMTESGLTLNIDRSTTAFRSRSSEESLIDFISRELKTDDLKRFRFEARSVENLSRKLKDLKIYTNHIKLNGNPQKRKHTIESMVIQNPSQERITKDDKPMTIEEYFRQTYSVKLEYRNVPLIQIKGGSPGNRKYLPVEVCSVYPNQPMPRQLISPDIQNLLVESSNTMTPVKRFDKIQDSRDSIVADDKENMMSKFGLKISDNPIKLKARELPEPQLSGDKQRLDKPVEGGLHSYLFFNLSKRAKSNVKECFDNFFNHPGFGLLKTAGRMGLRIKSQPLDQRLDIFTDNDLQSINSQMAAFESAATAAKKSFKEVQLLFVVIPDVVQLYEHIKLLSDIQIGIPTQCIKEDNFIRTKPGYFNNLTLKINAKLNGRNQVLSPSTFKQLPSFLAQPTMIIGADVCHPGYHNPLANERVISSIAAVVGSYDKEFTKYVANVSAQPARTEIIADFDVMVGNLLKFFSNKWKGILPKHVILFRDGVSESQLDAVRNEEVPLIEKAYRKLNAPGKPLITVFVVQKRHHTRLMPTQSDGNVRAGTVVDHTITSPFYEEFHLCSHYGSLGTSRHAKYATIRDDHNMTPDQKQKLAFYMCYAYCRCPTPISIPIAVKYADLAAYRTKQHTNQLSLRYESKRKDESEDQKRDREKKSIDHLNRNIKIHENLAFLPYYC